jgi:hypothetical protein
MVGSIGEVLAWLSASGGSKATIIGKSRFHRPGGQLRLLLLAGRRKAESGAEAVALDDDFLPQTSRHAGNTTQDRYLTTPLTHQPGAKLA